VGKACFRRVRKTPIRPDQERMEVRESSLKQPSDSCKDWETGLREHLPERILAAALQKGTVAASNIERRALSGGNRYPHKKDIKREGSLNNVSCEERCRKLERDT